MALFAWYSWVRKIWSLSKIENIVRRWGSDDDVAGWVQGVSMFRFIPSGPTKVLGSGS